MPEIGNRILALRTQQKISLEDASNYLHIDSNELYDIEINHGDYDFGLLLRCAELYKSSIDFILHENSKILIFKTPDEGDFNKFDEKIRCSDKLINPLKKNFFYIKKPSCCRLPAEKYFAWRVPESKFCTSGYVIMSVSNKIKENDLILAVVNKRPTYGIYKIEGGEGCICPITDLKKHYFFRAKGVKFIGKVVNLVIDTD